MWVQNSNHQPGQIMVHKPGRWNYGDWETGGKIIFTFEQVGGRFVFIPIKELQVRHLANIGTAIDNKQRELCYVPWILNYIKEVLTDGT